MLTPIEIGCFVHLFNRGGYVLDFSTPDFDSFTYRHVGVPLCERYKLSKGKSLIAYIQEAEPHDSEKLLFALLEHYEANFAKEYDAKSYDGLYSDSYDAEMAHLFAKCCEYKDRELAKQAPIDAQVNYIRSKFSSNYMADQIDLLIGMRTSNPTEAIGKAKELVESCCKTILNHYGIEVTSDWDVTRLSKETAKCLNINADAVTDNKPDSKVVKKILGSLQGLVGGIAEFRNLYGSGHGKGDNFEHLPARHAKLAVGSAVTLVEYYWETFEWRTK